MNRQVHFQPLAQALRPGNFGEFFGQEEALAKTLPHLGGAGFPSFLFYGPPGCGKSTLALLLAEKSGLPFERLSAPGAGVAKVRAAKSPVLLLDEIHRFSKAQQDEFLPLVENGSLILLATTTENPGTAITPQLLSRLHVVKLKTLSGEALAKIGRRGLSAMKIPADRGLLDFLCVFSGGDARSLLSAIELLPGLGTTNPEKLAELLPERVGRHGSESHCTKISALIKSIRKGAPQAAIYWLAALLKSGEDPAYICRRLVISAAEDIGLANPTAIVIAQSCLASVEKTGMPEAGIIMAECVLYLAMSPKSRSACEALFRAYEDIDANGTAPVPPFLRTAHSPGHLKRRAGEYLPFDETFYLPAESGREKSLFETWKNRGENFG